MARRSLGRCFRCAGVLRLAALTSFLDIFCPQYFPQTAVENLPNPFNLPLVWHGVNMAEGLKALPSTYRFTHNQSGKRCGSFAWQRSDHCTRSWQSIFWMGSTFRVSWASVWNIFCRRVLGWIGSCKRVSIKFRWQLDLTLSLEPSCV